MTWLRRLLGLHRRASPKPRPIKRWGLVWRSRNRLDGERTHIIIMDDLQPALFKTRAAARRYAKQRFGYIAERPDLQAEPHGWRMPRAVRITVAAV